MMNQIKNIKFKIIFITSIYYFHKFIMSFYILTFLHQFITDLYLKYKIHKETSSL